MKRGEDHNIGGDKSPDNKSPGNEFPGNGPKALLGSALDWVRGPSRAVAVAVLLVVAVLFGRDVLSSWHVRGELRGLEQRRDELRRSIAADSTLLERLNDPRFLEKYARENYLMRKAGDEVYIVGE